MKTLTLWTIISILFMSCSAENEPSILEASQTKSMGDSTLRRAGLYPENSANSYDAAGQLYYDISDAYLLHGNISVTTSGTITEVERIANLNEDFVSILPAAYISPTVARIDYILSIEQPTALGIIANSSMTSKAKTSLTSFATTLMLYRDLQKDYDSIYRLIVDYETVIIADNTLTTNDKKIILTTTSVSRYSFYFAAKHRRKPRDRDWEISWGHIVASTDGSEESTACAVVMSAVCGIIINK